MLREWIAVLLCALMFAGSTGCRAEGPGKRDGWEERTAEEAAHMLGLTAEQRQEDFAYLERELRDSYPCWGILEREGIDYDAIFEEYREMVANEDSDVSLYVAVNSALYRLGGAGHLSLLQPEWYEEFKEAYAETEDRTQWYQAMDAPASREGYPRLSEMVQAAFPEETDSAEGMGTSSSENITSLIIEEGKIAYLKIDSFMGTYDVDRKRVIAFLNEVRGYDHLILDISQNSGGSDYYWRDLLVAQLANETLSSTNYALVRNSENTAKYLQEAFGEDGLRPIAELPALPRLEARDREIATHFLENTLTVEPAGDGFHGKIWLLVGNLVYSSAEAFTVFCRDTGFATIVGTATGGDGIGIDPVFIRLPNSGILARYSPLFGLNPDGSSNEEYGTTPDILSPDGEEPLVTALRAIRA